MAKTLRITIKLCIGHRINGWASKFATKATEVRPESWCKKLICCRCVWKVTMAPLMAALTTATS